MEKSKIIWILFYDPYIVWCIYLWWLHCCSSKCLINILFFWQQNSRTKANQTMGGNESRIALRNRRKNNTTRREKKIGKLWNIQQRRDSKSNLQNKLRYLFKSKCDWHWDVCVSTRYDGKRETSKRTTFVAS